MPVIAGFAILSIVVGSISEVTIDVVFTEPFLDDFDAINPANYTFTNGTYTKKVEVIALNSVRLWVEKPTDLQTTLAVNNIKNLFSIPINPFNNSYDFYFPQSEALMAGNKNLTRTSNNSSHIMYDETRVYVGSDKGLDIFKKNSPTSLDKWAHIFLPNGIDAMHVSSFGAVYSVNDTNSPYFSSRVPAPNSSVTGGAVSFELTDLVSAPNIETLKVYINNELMFNGVEGGFIGSWAGIIDTGYKTLAATFYPDETFDDGDEISVRVVVEDLEKNQLTETYSFNISILLTEGFGGSGFGQSEFGGV